MWATGRGVGVACKESCGGADGVCSGVYISWPNIGQTSGGYIVDVLMVGPLAQTWHKRGTAQASHAKRLRNESVSRCAGAAKPVRRANTRVLRTGSYSYDRLYTHDRG